MNYTINNNNDTNYIVLAIPQPPKVYAVYPSEPIGYECRGRDTDTDDDSDDRCVVIVDIMS